MGLKVCLDGLKKDDEEGKVAVEPEGTRDDEPTADAMPPVEEVPDVVPLDVEVKLTPRTHDAVVSEMDALCLEYAQANTREKAAKKIKDKTKLKLLKIFEQQDITERETLEGRFVVIVKKDSKGVLVKEAVKLLTEEQIKACTGVTRKGSTSLSFYPVTDAD